MTKLRKRVKMIIDMIILGLLAISFNLLMVIVLSKLGGINGFTFKKT